MPGPPVQRIDAQPAVVGEGGQAGQVRRLARLQVGIVGEAVADLLGLGKAELLGADAGNPERLDQRRDLAQLARIVGRDDQPVADRPHRADRLQLRRENLGAADAGEAEQPQQAFLVDSIRLPR